MPVHQRQPYIDARKEVSKSAGINFWFSRFASATAQIVGHPYMFLAAVIVLIAWAVSGPLFHFSDTWQLIINTGTTIVTFLVVFLIQNTQNRDAKALHLKLDELIRSHHPANDDLIDIQKLSDEELDELEKRYENIRKACEARRAAHKSGAEAAANEIVQDSTVVDNGRAKKKSTQKPAA
ncbi:MAG TPA: low affinity iron permease family protein [Candidatus Angelobacter sp.]|nr:low affinity iron permease family protein [Candidatus Angelobacter sp.]